MKILITGGSGLVGQEVSRKLILSSHEVVHLSRHPQNRHPDIKEYKWDPDTGDYDLNALEGVESIINLAGAPVNQKWTASAKREILASRTESLRLLFSMVREANIKLKSFISASGVGYYPTDLNEVFSEDSKRGNAFLSEVCVAWENQALQFELLKVAPTIFRIGVVLSPNGGALKEMLRPVKLGVGSPLGSGEQWMPWIHIEDLAKMMIHTIENSISGIYNAASPNPMRNKDFMKTLAGVMKKPFFMPAVPKFILKLIMGEVSTIALDGQNVSCSKIESTGFKFQFTKLEKALSDLLK